MELRKLFRVCVTGAAGRIAYTLYQRICMGSVFGPNVDVELVLLDIPRCQKLLDGLVLELQDCGFDLLKKVITATDPESGFVDCDVIVFLGGFPRGPNMTRGDLLNKNIGIFQAQGAALNKVAKKSCMSLVIANPANSLCYVLAQQCPNIPGQNFTALTRLDQNRARYQLAHKLNCTPSSVQNLIIWGNHSPTMFPNYEEANFENVQITKLIKDEEYLKNEFLNRVKKRGKEIIDTRGFSSVMSAGKAICDHLSEWYHGNNEGIFTSMAVLSDGCYDVEKGLYCSFPVHCTGNFGYEINKDVKLSVFAQEQIQTSVQELLEEKEKALKKVQPKL